MGGFTLKVIVLKKGNLLNEGKTKRVYEVVGKPDLVIIENKDDITKNDDPTQTKKMVNKAKLSTTITCINFEILKMAGIPVAYQKKISENEFLAKKCQMIPLEVIVRRYAVGSVLLRCPSFKVSSPVPFRFEQLSFEVFLKTTGGIILSREGKEIGRLIDKKSGKPIDDPLIANPRSLDWIIKNPKTLFNDELSVLGVLPRENILPKKLSRVSIEKIEMIATRTFLVLEEALILLNLRLVDFKIEFGIGPHGELFVADVIDNDSWRLRTSNWKELSKELFRQNRDMKEIKESYELVAKKLEAAYPLRWQ